MTADHFLPPPRIALLQKLFSDDFLSGEIKRRRREMFIVTDCTSFTVFPNEQNALHFAHSEGTREPAVYYKHSAATRLFRCAPTSGNLKGTFAAKPPRIQHSNYNSSGHLTGLRSPPAARDCSS